MGIQPFLTLALLAKHVPLGGTGGPSPEEVLIFLGILGGGLLLWTLVSAALFRAGLAIFNRFAHAEDQTADVGIGKALLVGFVHVGALMVVSLVLSLAINLVIALVLGGLRAAPEPALVIVLFAVTLLAQSAGSWLTKALLSTAFIPCRFRSASWIATVWFLFELLLVGAMYGALALGLYLMGGFNGWRF